MNITAVNILRAANKVFPIGPPPPESELAQRHHGIWLDKDDQLMLTVWYHDRMWSVFEFDNPDTFEGYVTALEETKALIDRDLQVPASVPSTEP